MSGNKFGTNLPVWRSCVEPLAAVPQHARTDQGHQDLDAACPRGLRPFHGAPVLGVGRGFFHFGLRGVAFPCGLALPLPSSRNGRGQGWDAQGEGLAGRLGVGLGLASIRPGTLPEPFL